MGEESVRRVLCVIPDEDTYNLIRLQLQGSCAGCVTEHAASLSAAQAAVQGGAYDLYIIDNWWLADGEGLDFCREIRSNDIRTPILFYSGNVFPSEIERALNAGAQAYIPLPDVSGELPGRVEQLLDDSERAKNEAAVSAALEEALRARALCEFMKAGGQRFAFERLWPRKKSA